MNHAELQRKLLAAARGEPVSDRVPYTFEKRVMAHIKSRGMPDAWIIWSRALWRAAAPCIALALLLGAWSWFGHATSQNSDLSQDFENTVLAAVDHEGATDSIW